VSGVLEGALNMSLLDTIAGMVEKHPDTTDEQHSNLVQTAMEMFGNHTGISQLLTNAQSQDLGQIVQSWIGSGSNQAIAPGQVQNVVGQDRLSEFAQRAGVPPTIASAALARILPALIDRWTPHGKLPEAA
jgi:uncharacterized protein YidB (DUF937 family)